MKGMTAVVIVSNGDLWCCVVTETATHLHFVSIQTIYAALFSLLLPHEVMLVLFPISRGRQTEGEE